MSDATPNESKKEVEVEGQDRFPDFTYTFLPNQISEFETDKDQVFYFFCKNKIVLRVAVINATCFRFSYALNREFERDFSYAIQPEFAKEKTEIKVYSDEASYIIETSALSCQIAKADLCIEIKDQQTGTVIVKDASPFQAQSTILQGLNELKVTHQHLEDTAYFGLGDKSCGLNLYGERLENWNTDAFGFRKQTDPLYRSIPFYYGLRQGTGYGIFLHNTHRSHFDFANANPDHCSFAAEGGEMGYFFFYGPELSAVYQQYMELTGKPELPALWALGFHQCRWSYFPDTRVKEVAEEFRSRKIPCDAIYLDIDYMDGYRCFTWNSSLFPKPAEMIADLKAEGFHTVVMIDPGIRADDDDYWVYRSGLEEDVFCRRTSGELMRGPVWPPDCVFPDYTLPKARAWWKELYQELYVEHGISGFWNDMNEPAVFKITHMTFPDNVVHDLDGQWGDHRRAHNIYGLLMSRATQEGLKDLQPAKRPFVLTRASFSGGQRYAALWTGDNIASWEHLRLANIQCQRLSISGFSFVGSDIGGFSEQPDGELFVRWLQLGLFHPLFRVHSMGNNVDGATQVDNEAVLQAERDERLDQEPWSFGEPYTTLARQAIEFRYQLLPYLYTAFQQYTAGGHPVIRSLAFTFQDDPYCIARENEFLFGNDMLVCPVLKPGAKEVKCYLPEGNWLDYYSGASFEGKRLHIVPATADRIPIFVRAGAVIPNYPVQQFVGEKQFETIELLVYPGESHSSILYEDQGEGYDYLEDGYKRRSFTWTTSGKQHKLQQEQEGNYIPSYSRFQLRFRGLSGLIASMNVDGRLYRDISPDEIIVPVDFKEILLEF